MVRVRDVGLVLGLGIGLGSRVKVRLIIIPINVYIHPTHSVWGVGVRVEDISYSSRPVHRHDRCRCCYMWFLQFAPWIYLALLADIVIDFHKKWLSNACLERGRYWLGIFGVFNCKP